MIAVQKLNTNKIVIIIAFFSSCLLATYSAKHIYLEHQKKVGFEELKTISDTFTKTIQEIKKTLSSFSDGLDTTHMINVQPLKNSPLKELSDLFFIKAVDGSINLDTSLFPNHAELNTLIDITIACGEPTASQIFCDSKNSQSFVWLCNPLYKKRKFIGVSLGKINLEQALKALYNRTNADICIAQNTTGNIAIIKNNFTNKISQDTQKLIQTTCLGEEIAQLHLNKTQASIFFTSYEPELSMGIVAVKQENKPALFFFILEWFFILTLIGTLIFLYCRIQNLITIQALLSFYKTLQPIHKSLLLGGLSFLAGGFILYQSTHLHRLIQQTTDVINKNHNLQNEFIAEKVNTTLYEIVATTDTLKEILHEPNAEASQATIEPIFATDPCICGVKISNKNTSCIWIKNADGSIKKQVLQESKLSNFKAGWSTPHIDSIVNKNVITFSAETKDAATSLCVLFEMAGIETLLQSTHSALIQDIAITTPQNNLIYSQKTPTLFRHNLFLPDQTTKNKNLSIPNWILTTTRCVDNNEIPFNLIRRLTILIIVSLVIFLSLILSLYQIEKPLPIASFSIQICSIFLLGNILLWSIIYTIPHADFSRATRINDKISREQFISKTLNVAENLHFKLPEVTQAGLLVQGLDLNQVNRVQVTAFAWHRSTNNKTPFGLALLHSQQQKFTEILYGSRNNLETKMWSLSAHITSLDDYTNYPFSVKHVMLQIIPEHLNTPILLVPSETMLATTTTPWISQELQTPGFTLKESFISIQHMNDSALTTITNTQNNKLIFNFIFRESLLGTLFTYVLPLLIILFSIFGLLWIKPEFRFTSYSGAFFAIVLLHRTLRTALNLTHICYLEYFFFFTYIALIALMIATLLELFKPTIFSKYEQLLKLAFWPLQFLLWLITTTVIFH